MTDRPISFVAPMIRALWDGRKTQTRRVLPQPNTGGIEPTVFRDPVTFGDDTQCFKWREEGTTQIVECGAQFAVGDRLWVREDWKAHTIADLTKPRDLPEYIGIEYMADGAHRGSLSEHGGFEPGRRRWSNHMPRWASRMTLTVTDVRVQRVQEIGSADCLAEGWPGATETQGKGGYRWFSELWDKLNAERGHGWDVNPWVAAYTFTVEKRNIDA